MKKLKIFLYFPPEATEKPITYHLIKEYDLLVNILHAEIQSSKHGKLTVEMEGPEDKLQQGLTFLSDQGVEYRIFNKTIIWNEEKCVHCGACTAVCPSRALTLDEEDWSLSFDQSKCLVCEACTKTCPLKAINVDIFL